VAIYYCDFSILKRQETKRDPQTGKQYKTGRKLSAVAKSAYIARQKLQHFEVSAAAAYIAGETIAGRKSGKTHNYAKKKGVVYTEVFLPTHAPRQFGDRQMLWNTVEYEEKREDSQLARVFVGALPRELNREEQIDVVREYMLTNFVANGMIADAAIHYPDSGNKNPHVHAMLSMREVKEDGFGNKERSWNNRQLLCSWREQWANVQNKALAAKGYDLEKDGVDHRSYEEQGSGLKAQIHEGKEATQLRRKGFFTEVAKYNEDVKAYNMAYTTEIEKQVKEATGNLTERLSQMEAQLVSMQADKQSPALPTDFIPSTDQIVLFEAEIPHVDTVGEWRDSRDMPLRDVVSLASLEVENLAVSLQQFRQEIKAGELSRKARVFQSRIERIHKRFASYKSIETEIFAAKQTLPGFSLRRFLEIDDPIKYLQDAQRGAYEGFVNEFGIEPQEELVEGKLAEYATTLESIEQERQQLPEMTIYQQRKARIREQAQKAYRSGERFCQDVKSVKVPGEHQKLTLAEEVKLTNEKIDFREAIALEIRREKEKKHERSKSGEQGQFLA